MKKGTIVLSFVLALVAVAMWVQKSEAYNRFSDGCSISSCHGGFRSGTYISNTLQDGVSWGTNLHSAHQAMVNRDCTACHPASGTNNPPIGGPSGDGFNGCMGCHGRDEDANNMGSGPGRGAGLRQHHWALGINCSGCHGDANPANFTPVGEDVPGARNVAYGIDPCSDAVYGTYGSDNDGDNLYDGNDPDCASPPVCGDGIVEGAEQCDDGNNVDGDGCQSDCQLPICGDNIVDTGEQCDDGNTVDGDGCQADCQLPYCGDSIVDPGEECDDGNNVNGDGCENDCTVTPAPVCGDGIVNGSEQCDDGNNVNGDGCENDCTFTPTGSCTEDDLPVVTEMEYNRGDKKLHLHGQAEDGTITVANAITGETLAEDIIVREGQWESEISGVGSSLKSVIIISSNRCAVVLSINANGKNNNDHGNGNKTNESILRSDD